MDFLAEVTQHIPNKGEHLVRYYGWYSHRQRGIRDKLRAAGEGEPAKPPIDRAALNAQKSAADGPRPGSISTWAMLIKRVYEVDPLACPCCGSQMKIVSFIERGQTEVIERILRHCGLWEGPLRTNAGPRAPPDESQVSTEPPDPHFVPDPEFLETECQESQAEATRELGVIPLAHGAKSSPASRKCSLSLAKSGYKWY